MNNPQMTILDWIEAYSHPDACRCAHCLQYWLLTGPTETPQGWAWGPFTAEEIYAAGGQLPLHRGEDARPA